MTKVRGVIPDGQSCLNCRVPARNGFIVHGRTCPEYGRISGAEKPKGGTR